MASRRHFLRSSGMATLGFMGLHYWLNGGTAHAACTASAPGYGELLADPEGILNLPKGFSYKIISRQGDRMDDGLMVPGLPDGMAAFPGRNGRVIVVRNHELGPDRIKHGAFGESNQLLDKIGRDRFYDYGKIGRASCRKE